MVVEILGSAEGRAAGGGGWLENGQKAARTATRKTRAVGDRATQAGQGEGFE